MVQVWLIDSSGFYLNESKFVEEVFENMTTVPLLVGYVKPLFNGEEWVEGATEEEIKEWKEANKIDNCSEPPKTNKELTEENKLLKAQVEALSSNQDFYEECIVEMAALVYA